MTTQDTNEPVFIPAGNLDIEFENGQLSLFSHDLGRRIKCDPKQTKIVLEVLTQLRDRVEKAAAAQEEEESRPKPPPTIQERIDRLFG
mgnify:CR=1 FL=1